METFLELLETFPDQMIIENNNVCLKAVFHEKKIHIVLNVFQKKKSYCLESFQIAGNYSRSNERFSDYIK